MPRSGWPHYFLTRQVLNICVSVQNKLSLLSFISALLIYSFYFRFLSSSFIACLTERGLLKRFFNSQHTVYADELCAKALPESRRLRIRNVCRPYRSRVYRQQTITHLLTNKQTYAIGTLTFVYISADNTQRHVMVTKQVTPVWRRFVERLQSICTISYVLRRNQLFGIPEHKLSVTVQLLWVSDDD